jgi:hypothetical protein
MNWLMVELNGERLDLEVRERSVDMPICLNETFNPCVWNWSALRVGLITSQRASWHYSHFGSSDCIFELGGQYHDSICVSRAVL